MENDGLVRLSEYILLKTIGQSSADIRSGARSRLTQGVILAVVVLLGIATLAFALAALYLYLRLSLPALEAVALMACGLLFSTLCLWLAAILLPRSSAKNPKEKSEATTIVVDPAAAIVSNVIELIAEHPFKAGLAALAAGIVVGYSPEVRALLVRELTRGKSGEQTERS